MAEPTPTPQAGTWQVDPTRVLQKLQLLDANLVQLAMLQVVAEDQDEQIKQLRAELVKATSAASSDGPTEAPAKRR